MPHCHNGSNAEVLIFSDPMVDLLSELGATSVPGFFTCWICCLPTKLWAKGCGLTCLHFIFPSCCWLDLGKARALHDTSFVFPPDTSNSTSPEEWHRNQGMTAIAAIGVPSSKSTSFFHLFFIFFPLFECRSKSSRPSGSRSRLQASPFFDCQHQYLISFVPVKRSYFAEDVPCSLEKHWTLFS